MEEELQVIVSAPSGNDCPRSGVVPFGANPSHFVLSTPAGGGSANHTSSSLTYVAQDSHQPPLPRPRPPGAAQETAAAAISITSNAALEFWLGES